MNLTSAPLWWSHCDAWLGGFGLTWEHIRKIEAQTLLTMWSESTFDKDSQEIHEHIKLGT